MVLEDLYWWDYRLVFCIKKKRKTFKDLGIDIEESLYDILKVLAIKYDLTILKIKPITLAQKVKQVLTTKAQYTIEQTRWHKSRIESRLDYPLSW
jgi:type I restriction enzyme R subunit